MRVGMASHLSVVDLIALRFAVAGIVMVPVVMRRGWALDQLGWTGFAAIAIGGGTANTLVVGAGLAFAPVAYASAFAQGGRKATESRRSARSGSPTRQCLPRDCADKVFQICDRPRPFLAMYLATVDCATSIPSLSSSPWVRGAPHSRLARLISRISRRISTATFGRPPEERDLQRQYSRNPVRCHRMTVAGWTIVTAFNTDGNRR